MEHYDNLAERFWSEHPYHGQAPWTAEKHYLDRGRSRGWGSPPAFFHKPFPLAGHLSNPKYWGLLYGCVDHNAWLLAGYRAMSDQESDVNGPLHQQTQRMEQKFTELQAWAKTMGWETPASAFGP